MFRAAGASVGWGFQFQEPLFLVAISALLVAFASNLFGVFEIGSGTGALGGLGAGASGPQRSFFEGLLGASPHFLSFWIVRLRWCRRG